MPKIVLAQSAKLKVTEFFEWKRIRHKCNRWLFLQTAGYFLTSYFCLYGKARSSHLIRTFRFAVPIASIKELREGSATDAFTQCPDMFTDGRCISIIHGDNFSTLDLVIPTREKALHWTVGLRYLLAKKLGTFSYIK